MFFVLFTVVFCTSLRDSEKRLLDSFICLHVKKLTIKMTLTLTLTKRLAMNIVLFEVLTKIF